ncbi:MAG: GDP-mannose 4,6-dehydratase [Spirochaetia bacterium]|nr:GDP-mannose 4,6-dehydratase [Spirochaetia bacterium]
MRIFITGIAGFIGSSLARYFLKQDQFVSGIDNLFTGKRDNLPDSISWKFGDVGKKEDLNDINGDFDVIIHLAAQSSGEKSFSFPEYDIQTNILGSLNIYNFARARKAKLLINISSMSVYGEVDSSTVVDETHITNPVSLYGITKLGAERMLELFSQKDQFPVVSLRLFSAYGPGQNLDEMAQGIVSIYLAYLLREDHILVKGALDRMRDLTNIEDIISCITKIITSEKIKSGSYNLCTGKLTTVAEMISLLKKASKIEKPVISKGNTQGDIQGFCGSWQKLYRDYGWEPVINADQGITKMVNYYMESVKWKKN